MIRKSINCRQRKIDDLSIILPAEYPIMAPSQRSSYPLVFDQHNY